MNAAQIHPKILFSKVGVKICTIGILISVYGTINGYTMTGMRVPYAMAEEICSSATYRKINKIWRTVTHNIQLIIAIIMMSMGAFDTITNMLIFFDYICICCCNNFQER